MTQKSQRTTTEHPDLLEKLVDPPSIEDAIRLLLPRPTIAGLVELFDSRVTYDAIKSWRQERRNTPQWAIDLLAAKIQARADYLAHGARRIAAIIPGPGRIAAAANIRAWNERRAKEKAGSKPALPE